MPLYETLDAGFYILLAVFARTQTKEVTLKKEWRLFWKVLFGFVVFIAAMKSLFVFLKWYIYLVETFLE